MNATPLRALVFLLAMVGTLTAAEPSVRVAASQELRVAVVDATKATPARDAMHQAFATSLGAALSKQCGAPVGVRAKSVGVDHAAFNLGAGVYDAVLVVGAAVPAALRRTEAITLSAVPEGGKRERMLYLLIPTGDASLQGLLAAAFTGTVRDEKFIEAFGGEKRPVVAGERVAAQD